MPTTKHEPRPGHTPQSIKPTLGANLCTMGGRGSFAFGEYATMDTPNLLLWQAGEREPLEARLTELDSERQLIEGRLTVIAGLVNLADNCPKCGPGADVNHEIELTGWCETCGRVYVITDRLEGEADDGLLVCHWLDPAEPAHTGRLSKLEDMQKLSAASIWRNEALVERRRDLGPARVYELSMPDPATAGTDAAFEWTDTEITALEGAAARAVASGFVDAKGDLTSQAPAGFVLEVTTDENKIRQVIPRYAAVVLHKWYTR